MNEPPIKFELIDIPDYQAAMRKPTKNLADELKHMVVAHNSLGWPAANTGGFAAVYRLTDRSGKSTAVRCFIQLAADIADRYAKFGPLEDGGESPSGQGAVLRVDVVRREGRAD